MDKSWKDKIINLYAENYRIVNSSELEKRIGYGGPDSETVAACAGILTLIEVLKNTSNN